MAQRLVVPVADHGGRNRLAVGHAAVAERGADTEPLPKRLLQNLRLHRPHALDAQPSVGKRHAQRGVFVLQGAQRLVQGVQLRVFRRHAERQRRHGLTGRRRAPRPDSHARPRAVQPDGAAEHAGLRPLHLLVPAALVQAQFLYLLAADAVARLHRAAEHLEKGDAAALPVVRDAVYRRAEGGGGVIMRFSQPVQRPEQPVHSLAAQGRAPQAGKQLARADQPPRRRKGRGLVRLAAQIGLQEFVVPFGERRQHFRGKAGVHVRNIR